ncbi:MAG: hypothetical protein AAFW00_10170 [Bacteroidota bacterium]
MRVIFTIFIGLIGLGSSTFAQVPLNQLDAHQYRYETNPVYRSVIDSIEQIYYRYMTSEPEYHRQTVLQIPVVVHIMHSPDDPTPLDGTSNPTDDQIRRGLQWVNMAFRNTGLFSDGPQFTNAVDPQNIRSDSLPFLNLNVDTQIEFILAKSDPNKNPTTGITRTATDLTNLAYLDACPGGGGTQDQCLKALKRWNTADYFNIWLVSSICKIKGEGCNEDGFALPEGIRQNAPQLDGLVLEVDRWGVDPYLTTRAVHNIGHYLSLFDTYLQTSGTDGCGTAQDSSCFSQGDKICDTPPDAFSGGGNCTSGWAVNSCYTDSLLPGSPYIRDVEDIFENYMDGALPGQYVCKNSFTKDQKKRMRLSVALRGGFINSPGTKEFFTDLSIVRIRHPQLVVCGSSLVPQIILRNNGNREITSFSLNIQLDGNDASDIDWEGMLYPGDTLELTGEPILGLNPNPHLFKAEIGSINDGQTDLYPADNVWEQPFTTVDANKRVTSFPYCENMEFGILPIKWTTANLDGKIGFDIMEGTGCQGATDPNRFTIRYGSGDAYNQGQTAAPFGTKDLLISPILDLTDLQNALLTFDYAHQFLGDEQSMDLRVLVLPDCDARIREIWGKSGAALETVSSITGPAIPGWRPFNCGDWDRATINLDLYTGQKVRLIFEVKLKGPYAQNFYIDNICISEDAPCEIPTAIPTQQGVYQADYTSCTDSAGWTHFIKSAGEPPISAEDLLLFSVRQPLGTSTILGPEDVTLYVTGSYGQGGHDVSYNAPYVENVQGWHVMGRYVKLTPTTQPDDSVEIRFYYDDQDFEDMRTAIEPNTLDGHERLMFYCISKETEANPSLLHINIDAPSYQEFAHTQFSFSADKGWKGNAFDQYRSATFYVSQLHAIGGGTGGYGMSYGARYPVSLKGGLRASQQGTDIVLEWATPREKRSETFEIYHGRDTANLEMIAEINAKGRSTSTSRYQLPHNVMSKGDHYYFVKMRHADGIEVLTDTIQVDFDPSKVIDVYPNPTTNEIKIQLDVPAGTLIDFGIYNGNWDRMSQYYWEHDPTQVTCLDLSKLPSGIFFYVVRFNETAIGDKLILLR